jgi:adenine C2-methylase RlmN of 23S rRNA A2503 and tRNA A37
MATKTVSKKNIDPVSFVGPMGGPGTQWYDWAIKSYNKSFVNATSLTVDIIEKLKEEYRWTQLSEMAEKGARYERETGCFLLPIPADKWVGVK